MEDLKFKVLSEVHSKALQERLFELGYNWSSGNKFQKNYKYLFCQHNDNSITFSNTVDWFENHSAKLTTLDELYIEAPEKKRVVGRWYSPEQGSRYVYCFNGGNTAYGFDWSGEWSTALCVGSDETDYELTKDEVLILIEKEVAKRDLLSCESYTTQTEITYQRKEGGHLRIWDTEGTEMTRFYAQEAGGFLLKDGKWSTPSKIELPEILGYEGKHNKANNTINYGCKSIPAEFILSEAFNYVTEMEFYDDYVGVKDLSAVKKWCVKNLT